MSGHISFAPVGRLRVRSVLCQEEPPRNATGKREILDAGQNPRTPGHALARNRYAPAQSARRVFHGSRCAHRLHGWHFLRGSSGGRERRFASKAGQEKSEYYGRLLSEQRKEAMAGRSSSPPRMVTTSLPGTRASQQQRHDTATAAPAAPAAAAVFSPGRRSRSRSVLTGG